MEYPASPIVLCLREDIRQPDILHKEKRDRVNPISTLQRASFCLRHRAPEFGRFWKGPGAGAAGTQWHTAHRDILEQILCEGLGALGLFVTGAEI